MSHVTPHPALAAMYQSRCPHWCAARAPQGSHQADVIDDGAMVLVDHVSANLGDDTILMELQRTVRWDGDGNLIEVVDGLQIGDESIPWSSIPRLLAGIETLRHIIGDGQKARTR